MDLAEKRGNADKVSQADTGIEGASQMMLAQGLERMTISKRNSSEADEAAEVDTEAILRELDIGRTTPRVNTNDQKIKIENVFTIKWVEENLKIFKDLHSLKGNTQLYPLVKSILNYFFDKGWTVVIITPFIDPERLKDIVGLSINHVAKESNLWILTRNKLNLFDQTIRKYRDYALEDVKLLAKGMISESFHSLVDEKYKRIYVPLGWFHLKCIAGISNDSASVISTTANFTSNHFDKFTGDDENIDTVQYSTMCLNDFEFKVMQPLWERLDDSVKIDMQASFGQNVSNT